MEEYHMYRNILFGMLAALWLSANVAAGNLSEPDSARLSAVLAAQPAELQVRYQWRHPQQTLDFFGIEPGMTVAEVFPGSGWYSPILLSYLGSDGVLVGADYPLQLWSNFSFANEAYVAKRAAWVEEWPEQAKSWAGDDGATAIALRLGDVPTSIDGSVDAVLFIRAFHNLNRFEAEGGFFTTAVTDSMRMLKPGGVLGVVQHQTTDGLADGSRGYMKQAELIAKLEGAGFEFVAASSINNNPADTPSAEDIVWRLPPSLMTSGEDPELRRKYEAIGESNRMTLLFRKPE
jgi:predicted methyltransferase